MKKILLLSTAISVLVATNFVIANTLEVDPPSLETYVSFGEWNTPGDFDGYTTQNNLDSVTVSNGMISGRCIGGDPYIRRNYVGGNRYALDPGSVFDIRIKYEADATLSNESNFAEYYFNNGSTWVHPYYVDRVKVDGQFHVYRVTTSSDMSWTYVVRVDMFRKGISNQTFGIDYIHAKLPIMVDPIYEAGSYFDYTSLAEWNTDGDFQDWSVKHMLYSEVAGGYLTVTNNSDGQIFKEGQPIKDLDMDLDNNKIIQIRLRRETNDNSRIDLFYGTTNTPGFSASRLMRLDGTCVPLDREFHIYQYDMSAVSNWTGILEGIRFDPTDTTGKGIDVDYIRIGRSIIPEPAMFLTIAFGGILMLLKRK